MSGFLTHLVARSAGAADQLTPRPWSRFEPAARPVEALDAPRDDSGPGAAPAQGDRTDPTGFRLPAVPAAPDERPGEWSGRGPVPPVEPSPPADGPTAAPGPPVHPSLPGPPPLPAAELSVGQPARWRGTVSTVAPPTRPGRVPVLPEEPEHGDDAPSERPVPVGRQPGGTPRLSGTGAAGAPAPAQAGSPQSPPASPGGRAGTPLRAPALRQPAESRDAGSARPAAAPLEDGPGRERQVRSAHRRREDRPPAQDDTPAAAVPRDTTPAPETRHLPGEATTSTVPVPATDAVGAARTTGDAGARAVVRHVRAHPRPEEFPLLGLLRPSVSAEVPVRAADRRAPDPGPTIEVTIGRVEVRTAPPTPPARRPSPPRPGVLPLVEYLARRTGGR